VLTEALRRQMGGATAGVEREGDPGLASAVCRALASAGWRVRTMSSPQTHPVRLSAETGTKRLQIKANVWRLDYLSVGRRMPRYFKVQPVGRYCLAPEEGWVVLVLFWWERLGVFAAFDPRCYQRACGRGARLSVAAQLLIDALGQGLAVGAEKGDEGKVGLITSFLPHYVGSQYAVHDLGKSRTALEALTAVLTGGHAQAERALWALTRDGEHRAADTVTAIESWSFRRRVLSAYSGRCAVCGTRDESVTAVRLIPAARFPYTCGETCNGIAFCPTHHLAYDRALIAIDPDYRVLSSQMRADELTEAKLRVGLDEFRPALRPYIVLPAETSFRPRPEYLELASTLRGWVP